MSFFFIVKKKSYTTLIFLFFFCIQNLIINPSNAQSVGIAATSITPDPSSLLEIRSTDKGLLIPRLTTTQRDAITTPATGLMIYNSTTNSFNFYNGSSWIVVATSSVVNSVTGTNNRISVAGTSSDPIVDISSSYVGQNSITTLGTISTGTWNGSLISSAFGGTGNGFTKFSGATTSEKTYTLPDVSTTILTTNAAITAAQGGTGNSSYTIGDLLYASGTTTLSKLAGVATGNALISGGVGTAPSWGKINLASHITGTLPVANGGTGAASAFTQGSVLFAGASGAYSQNNSNFFWDNTNSRLGLGNAAPGSTLDVKGTLRLSGSTSGYVGFAPAAAAGSTTYTLPSNDGTNGYVLSTNGSGTLSWAAIAANAWGLTGNSGTSSGTNFIGTTDAQDLMFKTSNTERLTINKTTGYIHLNQSNQSTIIGYQAAGSNAANTTAIGYQAMFANTSGTRNTAMGFVALAANITGSDNTAMGFVAMTSATGNNNTSLGSYAGYSLTSGNKNTYIGRFGGYFQTVGSQNIFIGDSTYMPSGNTGSNQLNIGNSIYGTNIYSSTPFIGIGNYTPGSALDVKGTLRLSGSTSGYVGFAPAAAAGSTTYTLPSADGASGQLLSTNGSGTLSWASASATAWGLTGTAGTNASTNFIGTTDNQDLVFKVNNIERARLISSSGDVKIGDITSGTFKATKELVMREDGDTYGSSILRLRNRTGENGAIFETTDTTHRLVDFIFKTSSNQRNIRYESRTTYSKIGIPAFHITGSDPDNPTFAVGDNYAAFNKNLKIGNYTTPTEALDVTGNLRFSGALMPNNNAGTTGNALISNGTSAAPTWGKIGLTTHISGTLPVANGGTGATTLTGILKGNGTSAFTAAAAGTDFVAPNAAITGATNLKITYDAKGLVTAGTTAAASDLSNGTTGTGTVVLAASPALTGTPTAPTAADGTNTTQIATTAFVMGQIPNRTYITSNVANSTTSLADVTGLSFSVTSSGTYFFKFFIPYNSAATNTGSRWTLDGPTATQLNYNVQQTLTATTGSSYSSSTYNGSAVNATSLTTGNVAIIEGVVTVSASGTIIARFNSENNGTAITALAGAFVNYGLLY